MLRNYQKKIEKRGKKEKKKKKNSVRVSSKEYKEKWK